MNGLRIPGRHQGGAALVIGLLLLMVLTVLAIAGMSSSSLEFIMAGNEQYRQNAFQAAETGIEQAITLETFNPSAAPQLREDIAMPNTATDFYTTTTAAQLAGAAQPALWGNSWDSFSTYHFEIESAGRSVRSARATNVQGLAVIAPADATVMPGPGAGSELK